VKLVMTLLVRDEEELLPLNLEHHLALGVDHFVITDNRSADATPEILADYSRRGLVTMLHELDDDFNQWRWVTRMARMAADCAADWILHCDADEFWCAESSLTAALHSVPADYGAAIVPRFNFPPTSEEMEPFYDRLIVRETQSTNSVGRPLPGKCCHRASQSVQIAQGNHDLQSDDLVVLPGSPPIEILHFPMRTFAQFERRIVTGGRAYVRNHEVPFDVGATWRRLYLLQQQGRLRDYWDGQVLTPARRAEGLAHGALQVDTRVRDSVQAAGRSASPIRT